MSLGAGRSVALGKLPGGVGWERISMATEDPLATRAVEGEGEFTPVLHAFQIWESVRFCLHWFPWETPSEVREFSMQIAPRLISSV